MTRILVAGLGDLGGKVAERLLARGDEVIGLRRSAATGPQGMTVWQHDLRQGPPVAAPLHAEQLVICLSANDRTAHGYRQTYVKAVANLLQLPPVERVVFVSSSSVWGQDDGGWIERDTPPSPTSWRGEILLEGEALVAARYPQAMLLRLAGLYGPGRKHLIDVVRSGGPVASPNAWTNRIHRDDAAQLICDLLRPGLAGGPHIGVDRRPARRIEVMNWLAARLGRPPLTAGQGSALGKRLRYHPPAGAAPLCYPDYRAGYGAQLASESPAV